jgi:hypothetical protein
VTTDRIPNPERRFVDHALTTFDQLTDWPAGAWDRDQAIVLHALNVLAEWKPAGTVLEQIDRKRAGT